MRGRPGKWAIVTAAAILLFGSCRTALAETQLIGIGAGGIGSLSGEEISEEPSVTVVETEQEISDSESPSSDADQETSETESTSLETEAETGSETAYQNGKKVCIDPGHQSPEIDMSAQEPIAPGATETKAKATTGTQGAYTGLGEYELNLQVSLLLRSELEERGYAVVMTRENNETAISNRERAELAASEGADVLVRIHANGSDDHSVSGALTMVPSPDNPYVGSMYEECYALGEKILAAYCEKTGFSSLGVQYYDNMSGINWSTIPVTILEMGFMTNESEDYTMADESFWPVMAEGIADGIDDYFGFAHDAAQTASQEPETAVTEGETAAEAQTGAEETATEAQTATEETETEKDTGTEEESSAKETESDRETETEEESAAKDTEPSVTVVTEMETQETETQETETQEAETAKTSAEDELESQKFNELQETLYVYLSEHANEGENWAIAVLDPETAQKIEINNAQMQAASLIKLFIMGAVYEDYDSLQEIYGADTLDSLLNSMITVSDNDAANTLTGYLGGGDSSAGMERVNQFCQNQGFSDTVMGRLLLAPADNGDNLTSVADCAEFLRKAYQGEFPDGEAMVNLLKQQQRTHKIPAGVPEGVTVANKTGELDDVENDAAIVYADSPYILCVMSENLLNAGTAQAEIVEISSAVYTGLNLEAIG